MTFQYGLKGQILNPGRFQDLAFEREKLFRFNALIAVWRKLLKVEIYWDQDKLY